MRAPLEQASRAVLAGTVLASVRREYPHLLAQELQGDASLRPPRELHPAFYGSYDWHSAVHGHWALVRLLAGGLPAGLAAAVEATLDEHLRADRLARELAFFAGPEGRSAERPYGWSWLLRLHAELDRAGDRRSAATAPLASHLRTRLVEYFGKTLAFPIRSGTHADTAFSLRLLLQVARDVGDAELVDTVTGATRRWFAGEERLAWFAPASGGDFLDPVLTEAALVAEVMGPQELAGWLRRTGAEETAVWAAPPAFRPDGQDPATVHLEGLVLSKAWCLQRLARALPGEDPLARLAGRGAAAHLEQAGGLDPTAGFNRAHWLPTFLVYLDAELAGS